jgi:hypothetical protein
VTVDFIEEFRNPLIWARLSNFKVILFCWCNPPSHLSVT